MESFFIETDRLKLYPAHPRLSEELTSVMLDTFDTLHPWMSFAQYPPTVAQSNELLKHSFNGFVEKKQFHVVICLKNDNKCVGMCFIDTQNNLAPINGTVPYDVGYWLHKAYTGKGYTTEAVKALIQYVHQQTKFKLFSINCRANNLASCKVAEKLNFQLISESDIQLGGHRSDWPEKDVCKIYILHLDKIIL